jgi:hypothetical protein
VQKKNASNWNIGSICSQKRERKRIDADRTESKEDTLI